MRKAAARVSRNASASAAPVSAAASRSSSAARPSSPWYSRLYGTAMNARRRGRRCADRGEEAGRADALRLAGERIDPGLDVRLVAPPG